jgi:hypothetical protein
MLASLLARVEERVPERWRPTLAVRAFGLTRVPMLFLARPVVETLTETRCVVRIPLAWLTRNHVNAMYIAALTMGADVAGGLIALAEARQAKVRIVPIFKDLRAEFARRAHGDVRFICDEGAAIRALVQRCVATRERQSLPVHVSARVGDEEVATFVLTLSIKPAG